MRNTKLKISRKFRDNTKTKIFAATLTIGQKKVRGKISSVNFTIAQKKARIKISSVKIKIKIAHRKVRDGSQTILAQ